MSAREREREREREMSRPKRGERSGSACAGWCQPSEENGLRLGRKGWEWAGPRIFRPETVLKNSPDLTFSEKIINQINSK